MTENNERPTHVDLFTGIGGFTIAAGWAGFRTLAFCEIEPFCQRVLAKHWPYILNIPNIRDFDGTIFRGIDLLTGGFPCQPFSLAGKRRGTADDRAIWPEMLRVIKEARPAWVLGENVVGILDMELDQVLLDLESIGYTARTFIIPACAVDAQHKRERIWVVANANRGAGARTQRRIASETFPVAFANRPQHCSAKQPCRTGAKEWAESELGHAIDAYAEGKRLQRQRPAGEQEPEAHGGQGLSVCRCSDRSVWEAEPRVGRVADGIPDRSHRLRALGNAIVPQCAYPILKAIREQIFLQNERNLKQK